MAVAKKSKSKTMSAVVMSDNRPVGNRAWDAAPSGAGATWEAEPGMGCLGVVGPEDEGEEEEEAYPEFMGLDPVLGTALVELVRKKWQLRALQAQREQEELMRANAWREARAVNGVGQVVRQVHAFAYHDWALKLGSYECWRDPGFVKYFERIAPETKVRCGGTRTQVVAGWEGERRFRKSYGVI